MQGLTTNTKRLSPAATPTYCTRIRHSVGVKGVGGGGGGGGGDNVRLILRAFCRALAFCRARLVARALQHDRGGEGGESGTAGVAPQETRPSLNDQQAPPPPQQPSAPPAPPSPKAVSQLKRICDELVATEAEYVATLETVVEVFLQPLRADAKSASPKCDISSDEVDLVFGNVEVCDLHPVNGFDSRIRLPTRRCADAPQNQQRASAGAVLHLVP